MSTFSLAGQPLHSSYAYGTSDSRPVSPTSPFQNPHLAEDAAHDSDSESSSDLPFPQPLSRAAFSVHTAPHFSPAEFLATLRNRHQTLEDLRLELRNRSRDLERELVELVNRDYADFVGLGRSLGDGENKVEDLRVGLLQFRREVEALQGKLAGVERDMRKELAKRKGVRAEKNFVKSLLGITQRLDDLEMLLILNNDGDTAANGNEQDAGRPEVFAIPDIFGSGADGLNDIPRLERLVDAYLCLKHVISKLPPGTAENHVFMKPQMQRLNRVRKTILLDLGTAMRGVASPAEEGMILEAEEARRKEKVLKLMDLFLGIGEQAEAVRILKEVGRSGSAKKAGGGATAAGKSTVRGTQMTSATAGSSRIKVFSN
ncbi:oligomeric golgi complex component, COG2-domain-containing protein [Kalaharituber pfeilii]|nr:oligomeric golgi complex component, COG2-domain-containing protein [Kalaharituber pfeilii]